MEELISTSAKCTRPVASRMALAEDGGPAIMAKLSGPGPAKYFLRGTCGYVLHDPSKPRSPAYKLGARVWPSTARNDGPGPAAYFVPPKVVRMGRDGYPAYSLYGRAKDAKAFCTPGPGESIIPAAWCREDDASRCVVTEMRVYVFALCCMVLANGLGELRTPSCSKQKGCWAAGLSDQRVTFGMYLVDAYAAERCPPTTVAKAPSYTFGLRTALFSRQKTPAPNAYSLPTIVGSKSVDKSSPPSYSMTGRSKIGGFHQDTKQVTGLK